MKKIILGVLIFLFIFLGIGLVWSFSGGITGDVIYEDLPHYTRAICDDDNFCQDYKIYCEDGELVRMVPIDGAVIQHFDDWIDPRDKNKELC